MTTTTDNNNNNNNGTTTGESGNGGALPNSTSTTSFPMFIPSANIKGEDDENNLDLDDLFRDCYFGDFSVEAASAAAETGTSITGSGPPPPPPPPATATTTGAIAPLVSNKSFYTSQPKIAEASGVTTAKRKAEEALEQATADSGKPYIKKAATESSEGPPKALTAQQKVERRERNRKHAKRSRLRKKFLLESLQEQISGLQSEIDSLKHIIKKECPDKAEKLLESVNGPKANFTPLPMPSGFGPVKALMLPDFRLMSALSGSQQNFAISDPSLPDNPIVYVSQGFLDLTGYTLDQVLGRNCRFLQGPGTDQSAVDIIRKGVREGVDTSVCLLNYKADGTPFWNQFFVAALRDAENNVVNFVGVQCEVSKAVVEKQMAQLEEDTKQAEKE